MAKSARLRLSDLRAVHRLVGECRDLGDDPAGWCRHAAAGLPRLVDGEFGGAWHCDGLADRKVRALGIFDWGWDNGLDRAGWERSVGEFCHNPFYSRTYSRYLARLADDDGACLGRTDLMRDHDWYQSGMFRHINRPMGVDNHLWCYRAVPGFADEYVGSTVARVPGRPDFTGREKAVVREAYALLVPLVGGPLARFGEPSPADLPLRVRQVLKCLLEGDTDKQVAARLGVSSHTAHQYVKAVFRHFGVGSRSELLVRWIKRGWNNRAAWADL